MLLRYNQHTRNKLATTFATSIHIFDGCKDKKTGSLGAGKGRGRATWALGHL